MTPRRIEVEVGSFAVNGRLPLRREEIGDAIRREISQIETSGRPLSALSAAALEGAVESAVARALGGGPLGQVGR